MSEPQTSWTTLVWQLKWWWMLPMGFIGVLFVALVLLSDTSGDAPFVYSLF
jgi:hypothetical protein